MVVCDVIKIVWIVKNIPFSTTIPTKHDPFLDKTLMCISDAVVSYDWKEQSLRKKNYPKDLLLNFYPYQYIPFSKQMELFWKEKISPFP